MTSAAAKPGVTVSDPVVPGRVVPGRVVLPAALDSGTPAFNPSVPDPAAAVGRPSVDGLPPTVDPGVPAPAVADPGALVPEPGALAPAVVPVGMPAELAPVPAVVPPSVPAVDAPAGLVLELGVGPDAAGPGLGALVPEPGALDVLGAVEVVEPPVFEGTAGFAEPVVAAPDVAVPAVDACG
ncbi:MAG: hypothetical protein HOV71_25915, partial [Hamadaea sp.]|nr:hypothetical protein [Hamadaea sp.]